MYAFSPFHAAFHFFIRLHASGGFHLQRAHQRSVDTVQMYLYGTALLRSDAGTETFGAPLAEVHTANNQRITIIYSRPMLS